MCRRSGGTAARLIERLGIAYQMRDKTVLETRSGMTAANVTEGKSELAFTIISEILPFAGVEVAGPLPAEIQSYVEFAAGISPASRNHDAAKAFIDFMKAPSALPVLKAKGMEPG